MPEKTEENPAGITETQDTPEGKKLRAAVTKATGAGSGRVAIASVNSFKDDFIIDRNAGTWERETGVWPFRKRETGQLSALASLESMRLTREDRNSRNAPTYTDVWAVRLLWRDSARAPVELRAFDAPTAAVGRALALEQHGKLAQAMGLPLLTDDAPAPVAAFDLPLRPADSRLTVAALSDGVEITLPRPSILMAFLPALFLLPFFLGFVGCAEIQHREFLRNVPPESRAFFERSGSPASFFLPFGLGFIAIVGVVGYVAQRAAGEPRRLTLTSDALTLHYAESGCEGREQRLSWSELSAARILRSGGASTVSVGGGGMNLTLPTGRNSAGAVIVYGATVRDTPVSGAGLQEGDAQWLVALLQAVMHAETRTAILAETLQRPFAPPVARAGFRPSFQVNRSTLIPLALIGLTLLNSYAGGLTLLQSWRDDTGRRYVRSDSLWRSHVICREPDGRILEGRAAYSPFSSSNSGNKIPSENAVSDSRWRIALDATAEAEINALRR